MISDRRLTWNGKLCEEESNKASTLICMDARMAFAFTGLAKFHSFRTRFWLAEALMEVAGPDHLIDPMIHRFRDKATAEFCKLAGTAEDKRLSVMFVGYVYEPDGPRAYCFRVSNFERGDDPPLTTHKADFDVSWWREKRPQETEFAGVFPAGTERALRESDLKSLYLMLRQGKQSFALVGKAVKAIRSAADTPAAGGRIGKQCSSIVIPVEIEQAAVVEYHSMTARHRVYGVSHIEARGSPCGVYCTVDPEFESYSQNKKPVVLAVPKVPRNAPCPCKSGKKYKRCHGVTER
jgi:SEC-C motif